MAFPWIYMGPLWAPYCLLVLYGNMDLIWAPSEQTEWQATSENKQALLQQL